MRRLIEKALPRPDRSKVEHVIPTSRVKRVIEIAFAESRRRGSQYVESGHLLMGLCIEGRGIAALVLRELGVTAAGVVAAVESVIDSSGPDSETPDLRIYGRP